MIAVTTSLAGWSVGCPFALRKLNNRRRVSTGALSLTQLHSASLPGGICLGGGFHSGRGHAADLN
jgi:hypothetical protein